MSFAGPVFAEDMTEEIQEDEQPGSEIELDIGGGGGGDRAQERRAGVSIPASAAGGGGTRSMCRTTPTRRSAGDPVDDELPGEGPEDLSGPDDDDDLPD